MSVVDVYCALNTVLLILYSSFLPEFSLKASCSLLSVCLSCDCHSSDFCHCPFTKVLLIILPYFLYLSLPSF